MPSDTQTFFSFHERLHKIAQTQLQNEIHDTASKTFFQAFVLGKAFKTFEAVLLLCHNGYGEDAFMLTRTLFELMVTDAYIMRDTTDDMLMRYLSYDWVTRKEMYDYIKENPGLLAQLNAELRSGGNANAISEVEAEYQKAMDTYRYRNGWSDKSIKGMSEAIGRSDMYSTVYKLQCTVGHTNARSMNEYARLGDSGTVFNIGANWDMVNTTLVIAFDCFFHILRESDQQFSWNIDKALEDLSQEYSAGVAKLHQQDVV